ARSCNIAHAVLLRNAWQSFHCELESRAHHASSPWNRQRYGGECARSSSRKNRRNAVRVSVCATLSNKTRFEYQEFTSGWWDLNPRPPGPEPGAIPSFATARSSEERRVGQTLCCLGTRGKAFNVN